MIFQLKDKSRKHVEKIKRKAARRELLHPGIGTILLASFGIVLFVVFNFFFPMTLTLAQALLNGIFTFSSVYLMAISYGVINDAVGTIGNVKYFSESHQLEQKKWWLVDSDGLIANAFASGIGAVHGLYITKNISIPALGAGLFGLAVFITTLVGLPFPSFTLPILGAGIVLGIISSEIFARYMVTRKDYPDIAERNYWRNSFRNHFGFVVVPLLAITALIATITVTALKINLPQLTGYSPLLIPTLFAALMAYTLLIGCIYVLCLNYPRSAKALPPSIPEPERVYHHHRLLPEEKRDIEDNLTLPSQDGQKQESVTIGENQHHFWSKRAEPEIEPCLFSQKNRS
jgi:hypothetical protein